MQNSTINEFLFSVCFLFINYSSTFFLVESCAFLIFIATLFQNLCYIKNVHALTELLGSHGSALGLALHQLSKVVRMGHDDSID